MNPHPFFIVCVRCSGSGVEHARSEPCTQCLGSRVLQASLSPRVVALEFLRVAQPVLGLEGFEDQSALRSAVDGISRWLATHPGDVVLEPPEPRTLLKPRSTEP
jgi:hypothetical protein